MKLPHFIYGLTCNEKTTNCSTYDDPVVRFVEYLIVQNLRLAVGEIYQEAYDETTEKEELTHEEVLSVLAPFKLYDRLYIGDFQVVKVSFCQHLYVFQELQVVPLFVISWLHVDSEIFELALYYILSDSNTSYLFSDVIAKCEHKHEASTQNRGVVLLSSQLRPATVYHRQDYHYKWIETNAAAQS